MAIAFGTRVSGQAAPNASLAALQPGTLLRVWADTLSLSNRTALALAAHKDKFWIGLEGPDYVTPAAIPYSALQRVDVGEPRSSAEGAARGFDIGLLAALAVDAVLAGAAATQKNNDGAVVPVVIGLVATPVIILGGTVIGASNPGHRWSVAYQRSVP
jgi:hypothetical protein